ncbi:MAG: mevalonate kinase [Proteobacteria bacterium]|nr:mevalonate kinase [Pseudomonadota bacterium]
MTWAFGKAILLGEHAVVYGHPALAGAIDCTLRCTLRIREQPGIGLLVPSWQLSVSSRDDHVVGRALRALAKILDAESLAADIAVDTALPPAAGLGSSAALSVALVRTLALATDQILSDQRVAELANHAERCFHQNPSGVDVALASRGGLGLYRRGEGMTPVDAPPIRLAVGLSGMPRRTADMVARIARARERDRPGTESDLAGLGNAAVAGKDAVIRGDLVELGQLMTRAHHTLARLGVSATELDEMVASALHSGAFGAKLTGAGGGGAVIAVAQERAEDILTAWQGRGYRGFVCNLGAKT